MTVTVMGVAMDSPPTTLPDCGVEVVWDPEDREAVRSHHRVLLTRTRERRGFGPQDSTTLLPGFRASVQRLLDDGYTYTDVSVLLGVTREAMRQWAERLDLRRGDHSRTQPRVWDWEKERFVAVSREEYLERAREEYRRKSVEDRDEHEEALERNARLQEAVRTVRRLRREKERMPYVKEVAEELGVSAPALARWTGYEADNDVSYAEAWDRLYRLAGLDRPGKDWSAYERD